MGFNSGFKGLRTQQRHTKVTNRYGFT